MKPKAPVDKLPTHQLLSEYIQALSDTEPKTGTPRDSRGDYYAKSRRDDLAHEIDQRIPVVTCKCQWTEDGNGGLLDPACARHAGPFLKGGVKPNSEGYLAVGSRAFEPAPAPAPKQSIRETRVCDKKTRGCVGSGFHDCRVVVYPLCNNHDEPYYQCANGTMGCQFGQQDGVRGQQQAHKCSSLLVEHGRGCECEPCLQRLTQERYKMPQGNAEWEQHWRDKGLWIDPTPEHTQRTQMKALLDLDEQIDQAISQIKTCDRLSIEKRARATTRSHLVLSALERARKTLTDQLFPEIVGERVVTKP